MICFHNFPPAVSQILTFLLNTCKNSKQITVVVCAESQNYIEFTCTIVREPQEYMFIRHSLKSDWRPEKYQNSDNLCILVRRFQRESILRKV
eukprot:TRINITY_DN14499_c0_g1_i1.p1 TRINITY_DN14499_c0_g1~~TRINITY_DN14499_c0_g1_i1.p1  ORF type:complete len:92 (-),score=2.12 TRINITY_DN14499_c0_g1_i1:65-340(-)